MTTELEWRRRWKADIKCCPWQQYSFGEDENYLIKVSFTESSYDIFVTDLETTWHENIDSDALKKRSKKLNPNVEAPLYKILDHIRDSVEEKNKATKYSVKQTKGGNELHLSISNTLAGIPFVWQFDTAASEGEVMVEQLTRPLLLMVGELNRRQQELCKALLAKDKEIEDYKAQGIRASRKHLETGPFDEVAFVNNMVVSSGFEEQMKSNGETAFDSVGQDLYKQIMTKQAWLLRGPQEAVEGESLMDEATAATGSASGPGNSWMDRVPGSVAGQTSSVSPKRSPQKSPAKPAPGSSPDPSPVKSTELMRRQALERKLQDQYDKKDQKAKKKKVPTATLR